MTSPIERLPVEVFEIIASDLDLAGYQQLRLSSRRLHSLSLSTFAKRYFSELNITLGNPTLDRLVSIAKHGYFSSIATQLNIKLLTYRDYKNLIAIRRVGIFPPPKRFHIVPGIKLADINSESELYNDLSGCTNLTCITDRLTLALKGLHNVKTIRFRAFHAEPEGWQYLGSMPDRDQKFRTKCFDAVLESIQASGIQLEEFSMAKRQKSTTLRRGADLPAAALQSCLVPSSMKHTFANLQSLTLALTAAYSGETRSRVPGWEKRTSQLILCAPTLRHLTLSLDRHAHISHYSASIIKSLASSCRLRNLESFQLVNCCLHASDLQQVLLAHAECLHTLSLHSVRLLSGSWFDFWPLLKLVQNLRCLRFGSLEGTDLVVTFFRARLSKSDKARSRVTLDTNVSGRPMNDMLDELIASSQSNAEPAADGFI
jgi:hypothetical protein